MRTSLYAILCIGIRLAAVLLAVNMLAAIPSTYQFVSNGDWGSEAWLILVLYLGALLLAFLLWVYPGLLARMAASRASNQIFESPVDAADLQYIAFSVVGLWLFFDGAFGLIHDGVSEMVLRHAMRGNNGGLDISEPNSRLIASFVVHLLQLASGGALVAGARGLVGALRRIRQGGLPPVAADETPISGGQL
jgi:hypothetical protein